MKKILFLAPLALAVFTSCSHSKDEPGVTDNGPVEFYASINDNVISRAYDQTWESGDEIGISCITGGKTYNNVAYSTTGNGDFTAVTTGSEIYYQNADPVTFTAYYPYTADAAAITADTHDQTKQKTFDYLWAQAQGEKGTPNVTFAFNHKMTKLVLTVKKGADISYNEVKAAAMTLAGFLNNGSFDVTTGVATASGNISGAWTFSTVAPVVYNDDDETATYTMILFPQEFTSELPVTASTSLQTFTTALDFTDANATIDDTDPRNEWVAGRQYNMSVTLHKTALTVNGCTISAWDEADGGNFDAE